MGVQPFIQRLIHILIDKAGAVFIQNIHAQAELMLTGACGGGDGLGLLRRLLIDGIHIIHFPAARHLIGDLACLGVIHMRLVRIGAVGTGDKVIKTRLFDRIKKGIEIRHVLRAVHHIARSFDFGDLRLVGG